MSETSYTFLLVGKTGVGKSAVGNSILGKYKFKSDDSSESVTDKYLIESGQRNGLNLTVVDTPGLMDTRLNVDTKIEPLLGQFKEMMSKCPTNGKVTVVIVIKYAERSTVENKTTIKVLEHIFGKDSLWKSCIIVMTHGEQFDDEYKGKKTFKEYISEQQGETGDLLKKCNYNCVLFYNKTNIVSKKLQQVEEFLQFARQIEKVYSIEKFKKAKREQNRLKLEENLVSIKAELKKEIQIISEKLNSMTLTTESFDEISSLEKEIIKLLGRTNEKDNPNQIYYIDGEQKLLEEIRTELSFLNKKLDHLKQNCKQLRDKDSIYSDLEEIKQNIDQFNMKDEDNANKIISFEEQLMSKEKNIHQMQLSNDFKKELLLIIENTKQTLISKKIKVQQVIETSLNTKIQNIYDYLKKLDYCNAETFSETAETVKKEIQDVYQQLQCIYATSSTDLIDQVKMSLKTFEDDLTLKEEYQNQLREKDNLLKCIEECETQVVKTDPNDKDIFILISNFENEFQKFQDLLNSKKLNAEFTNLLNLCISNSMKTLDSLKATVQRNYEQDINLEIKRLEDEISRVNSSKEIAPDTYEQISKNLNKLDCKLKESSEKIDKEFLSTVRLSMSKIEGNITKSFEIAEQSKIINELQIEIESIINEIEDVQINDAHVFDKIYMYQEKIQQLHAKIERYTFTRSLNSILYKAKLKLEKTLEKVREAIENELYSQISDLSTRANNLKDFDSNVFEVLSSMQIEVSNLEQKIRQQIHHLSVNAQAQFNSLLKEINEITKIKVQIMNIDNIKIRVSKTDVSDSEINEIIQKFEDEMQLISLILTNANTFNEDFTATIQFKLFEAKDELNLLKVKLKETKENNLFLKLKEIEKQFKNIDLSDEHFLVVLCNIKTNIENLFAELTTEKDSLSNTCIERVTLSLKEIEKDILKTEQDFQQLKVDQMTVKFKNESEENNKTDN